jgi:hypothetical protein
VAAAANRSASIHEPGRGSISTALLALLLFEDAVAVDASTAGEVRHAGGLRTDAFLTASSG